MTTEEIIDELLHEAEELKIREEVINLSRTLMESNSRMTRDVAIELALKHLKSH